MKLLHNNCMLPLLAVCALYCRPASAEQREFDSFLQSQQRELENIYLAERSEAIKTQLSIHIVDESGNDVPSARIVLDDNIFKITDVRGIAVFFDMGKGDYNIEVSARGCEMIKDLKMSYNPDKPEDLPLKFTLKALPTALVVGVMDIGGIVLADANVQISNRQVKTDAKGVARIDNIYLDKGAAMKVTKLGFTESSLNIVLPLRNWSTEVYQSVVLNRKDQFKLNAAFEINDSSKSPENNDDRQANAGESIKLPVTVENISDEITDSWTLAFRCDSPHLEFAKKPVYENKPLKPGEKRGFLIPVKIKPTVNKMEILRIAATIIPDNDFLGKSQTTFPLPVFPGKPLDFKLMIDPVIQDPVTGDLSQRNNGNSMLGPGEYGKIRVTIGNRGETVKNVKFILETSPSYLVPANTIKLQTDSPDGITIQANQIVDPVFTIEMPRDYDYPVISFLIMAESNGRVWGEMFTARVEGKSDFYASMEGRGRLTRGGLCNFVIKTTYTGAESFKGNITLSSPGGLVKMKPDKFSGRTMVSNNTIELDGILTIPSDLNSDRFKIKLDIHDLKDGDRSVFTKEFTFNIYETGEHKPQ